MYMYVKCDQNISCVSRVMSIFTKIPRLAGPMLSKASSLFCIPLGWTMLQRLSMQNLILIYNVVQELWTFSLTDHGWPDWCSAKSHPSNTAVTRASGLTILIANVCKIWSKYTTCIRFIKSYEHFHKLLSDGPTDSHSAHMLVVQSHVLTCLWHIRSANTRKRGSRKFCLRGPTLTTFF